MKKILFLNHKNKQCGVYQYGVSSFDILKKSEKYIFIYKEIDSEKEIENFISNFKVDLIIYNYHHYTFRFLTNNIKKYNKINIAISHDKINNNLFDFFIVVNPLIEENKNIFKSIPLLRPFDEKVNLLDVNIPVIGTVGFAFPTKRIDKIIELVQSEFDEAIIRIHSPSHFINDLNNVINSYLEYIKNIRLKDKIKLIISREFLIANDLIRFCSQHWVNIFLHNDNNEIGVSGAVEFGLSAKRPIMVSETKPFFHLKDSFKFISVDQGIRIKDVIERGLEPIQKYIDKWNYKKYLENFERILDKIL